MTTDFDSKRPDHPDFMTSHELKRRGFSGLRKNSLTSQLEFWVNGEVRKVISEAALLVGDSDLIVASAWKEVFQFIGEVSVEGRKNDCPIIH